MTSGFIPPHGGYQDLLSYRKSLIVYDATVQFCKRFLDKRDRTVDQMVQAARSGKQNIIEGSMASGTSKEMEIKLMNVARASLEELLEDYRDFLRTDGGALWDKNSKEAQFVRKQGRKKDESYMSYRTYLETRPGNVVSNIIICLIHQANYLLDQQIRQLEQAFLKEGGLRERMSKARRQARGINVIAVKCMAPAVVPYGTRCCSQHPLLFLADASGYKTLVFRVMPNRSLRIQILDVAAEFRIIDDTNVSGVQYRMGFDRVADRSASGIPAIICHQCDWFVGQIGQTEATFLVGCIPWRFAIPAAIQISRNFQTRTDSDSRYGVSFRINHFAAQSLLIRYQPNVRHVDCCVRLYRRTELLAHVSDFDISRHNDFNLIRVPFEQSIERIISGHVSVFFGDHLELVRHPVVWK